MPSALPDRICPCGQRVNRGVSGFWSTVGAVFGFVIGVALHALALLVLVAPNVPWWGRALAGAFILTFLVVALVAERRDGHRGWCYFRRSLRLFAYGPAALLAALGPF